MVIPGSNGGIQFFINLSHKGENPVVLDNGAVRERGCADVSCSSRVGVIWVVLWARNLRCDGHVNTLWLPSSLLRHTDLYPGVIIILSPS